MAATFNGTFDAATSSTNAEELIQAVSGLEPSLDDQYDLFKLNENDRLQVRVERNVAPREMVERFVNQMSRSQFPPIVVTEDAKIVDGNTRYRAHKQRETRYTPALVVPIRYDDAEPEMQHRLVLLGRMLNNSNGKPLERKERRDMIRGAIALGMSNQQIVGTVGFKPSAILAARRENAGEQALVRVGLPHDLLTDGPLGAIGQYDEIHDEPLRQLAQLTADANLTAREAKALAVDVSRAGSDDDALRIIGHAREANAQRILEIQRGGIGKPRASKALRQRLGFITQRAAEVMVESNPEDAREHLEAVRAAIAILAEIEKLQDERIKAAQPTP